MKKWMLMLFVVWMLASCAAPDQPESIPETDVIATQITETAAPAETTLPVETESKEAAIRAGTWATQGGIFGRYYIFDDNGLSGQTIAFKDGETVKFFYKEGEGTFLFYYPGQEEPKGCRIVLQDADTLTLEWDGEIVETLIYVSPKGVEDFHFYTYDELCYLALEDYRSKNDPSDHTLMAAAGENGDGSVTIQIYQNLSDHNSTAAWYWVDRMTGEGYVVGTDVPLDLTNGTPELAIDYFEGSKHQAVSYYECIADQSEYCSKLILTPEIPLVDVSVVRLEYVEAEDSCFFNVTKELFHAAQLTAEKPLILYLELPETIPNVGVIYSDRTGETKYCAIYMSGLDGAPLLEEETILDSK